MAAVVSRLAITRQRFVDLVSKDLAEVGDRRADLVDRDLGHRTEGETGDSRGRLVPPDPVQKDREMCQRNTDHGDIA